VVAAPIVDTLIHAAVSIASGCPAPDVLSASVYSLMEKVLSTMLYAKLKVIAFTALAAGAVATGAMVLAQDAAPRAEPASRPQADPALAAPTRETATTKGSVAHFTESGPGDRLRAVEQKLDRILEAIGSSRGQASTAFETFRDPAVASLPTSTTTASVANTNLPIAPPPASMPARLPVLGDTLASRPDRLAAVERRMEELERRIASIESRLELPNGARLSLPVKP
jgi:hypothetical protein